MYIKFDKNDKLYAYSYGETAPNQEFVYCETEYTPPELPYVVRRNGFITLDDMALQRDIDKTRNDIKICALKTELEVVKEDIEQEAFGLIREDYEIKKLRAAEIINELRILEGKEPRKTK